MWGSSIILSIILWSLAISSFISVMYDINFKKNFIMKANEVNTIIRYNTIDEVDFYRKNNINIYTIPEIKDMYELYTWNGIYLYWNYDKFTINDSDYLHNHLFPKQIYYCDKNFITRIIYCIRVY